MAQAIDNSGLPCDRHPGGRCPSRRQRRLYRVFQNLIGNALSTPARLPGLPELTWRGASQRRRAQHLRRELKPGADYTARFVRGDESRTDGGSGLGLSIAESFTRACGGSLTISTEADLFTAVVTFPLAE